MKRIILCLFLTLFTINLSAVESLDKFPYSGLILDKVELQGIEISDFKFENQKKLITVSPDETFSCTMSYEVDADDLESFHIYHLVIGLYDDGPQDCIVTSFGFRDAKGSKIVQLKAPEKKGVYEVRAAVGKGITCDQAKEDWVSNSSTKTVLGIVLVK